MLHYQEKKCLLAVSPLSKCSKCHDSCSKSAITISSSRLHINANCDNCGVCVHACTENALSLSDPITIKHPSLNDHYTIACSAVAKKSDTITVPCLASLTFEEFFEHLQQKNAITIIKSNCVQCQYHQSKKHVDLFIKRLKFFQQSLGWNEKAFEIIETENVSSHSFVQPQEAGKSRPQNISRRDLFAFLLKPMTTASSHPQLEENLKLSDTNFKTYLDTCNIALPSNLEFLFHFDIPKDCDGCDVCARLCPSSALKISINEKQKNLLFFQNQCNACNLCIDVCKFKDGKIKPVDFIPSEKTSNQKILRAFELKECMQCGFPLLLPIGSDQASKLCFVCQKRKIRGS